MAKFYVFCWPDYEASGGFNDLSAVCDTLDDAKQVPIAGENAEIWLIGNNQPFCVSAWDNGRPRWPDLKWSESKWVDQAAVESV